MAYVPIILEKHINGRISCYFNNSNVLLETNYLGHVSPIVKFYTNVFSNDMVFVFSVELWNNDK